MIEVYIFLSIIAIFFTCLHLFILPKNDLGRRIIAAAIGLILSLASSMTWFYPVVVSGGQKLEAGEVRWMYAVMTLFVFLNFFFIFYYVLEVGKRSIEE